ncbi:MAG TPA: hypothetical protein VK879_15205 [Candidatus Sulfomarinibacteraceae bacterium]|nr:hypothetical protein [Candidatus Sulfomarinibacteraceae bacterium]
MEPFLEIASLEIEQIQRIQELERQFGVQIMAFEPGRPAASLSDVQLQQIKELEETLGVILLAFESEAETPAAG